MEPEKSCRRVTTRSDSWVSTRRWWQRARVFVCDLQKIPVQEQHTHTHTLLHFFFWIFFHLATPISPSIRPVFSAKICFLAGPFSLALCDRHMHPFINSHYSRRLGNLTDAVSTVYPLFWRLFDGTSPKGWTKRDTDVSFVEALASTEREQRESERVQQLEKSVSRHSARRSSKFLLIGFVSSCCCCCCCSWVPPEAMQGCLSSGVGPLLPFAGPFCRQRRQEKGAPLLCADVTHLPRTNASWSK